MTSETNPTPAANEPTDAQKARRLELARVRYQAALGSAIVAGVFCLLVGATLAVAHLERQTEGLDTSEELNHLRAALLKVSDADARQAVLDDLRRRDVELRQDFFGRQAFMKTGGYLLAVGMLVFVVGAGLATACHKHVPMPPRADQRQPKAGAALARWAVVVVGAALVVGGGVVLLKYTPWLRPGGTGDGEATALIAPPPGAEEIRKHWPRFRGADGSGHSAYANIPTTWNGKTGKNILWKTPVPLPGENSPVVWGNRIFLSGATEKERQVYCFDAADGKILWQQPVSTPAGTMGEPPELLEDTGFAAPTLATDGRFVAAIFANGDVACFDVDGHPRWARNLGRLKNSYGYSSSLNIYANTVLVLLDQGTPGKPNSRLMALDVATGKTVWETPRPVPSSWATPILIHTGQREEFITAAKPWVIAYNPADGKELWRAKVLDGDVAPSPVGAGSMVFTVNSGAQLSAIRTGGSGDVTKTHVAWIGEDGLPDIVSPLTDGKFVLLVTTDGLLTCYAVADGKFLWEHEIDAIFMASPGLVGDKVYLVDAKGVTHILTTEGGCKEVAKAELGERCHSSPVFVDGRLYLRGKTHLYAIGVKTAETQPAPAAKEPS